MPIAVPDNKNTEMKNNIIEGLQRALKEKEHELEQSQNEVAAAENEIKRMAEDLQRNQRETAEVLEAAEALERESQNTN